MKPPKPVRFRVGMGCLGVFLSAFPGITLTIFYSFWEDDKPVPFLIAAAVCVPLLVTFLLGRSGVTVDPGKRRLVRWWGIWLPLLGELPLSWKIRPLEGLAEVLIGTRWRKTKNSEYCLFTVALTGPGGAREPLAEYGRFLKARARAERVAAATELPVRDRVPGENVTSARRSADTLDLPLKDRLRRDGESPAEPKPPAGTTLHAEKREDGIVFEIPRDLVGAVRRMWKTLAVIGLLSAILTLELAFEVRIETGLVVGVGVVLTLLALVALGTVVAATRRVTLHVSPAGLRRESRSRVSRSVREISAKDIEEVGVGPSRSTGRGMVVAAWGDRDIVEFGSGLAEADLEWIRQEIRYRLSRG